MAGVLSVVMKLGDENSKSWLKALDENKIETWKFFFLLKLFHS